MSIELVAAARFREALAFRDEEEDRRHCARVHPDETIHAWFHEVPVQIIDVSLTGVNILHSARFIPREAHDLRLQSSSSSMSFRATIVRSNLWHLGKGGADLTLYRSGLAILHAIGNSRDVLRALITARVERALDEQKANAHGIPPLVGAPLVMLRAPERFWRCEWIDGRWRRSETSHPQQPSNGFTVGTNVGRRELQLLCETWECSTAEGRQLTQLLAELANSGTAGMATRKYEP